MFRNFLQTGFSRDVSLSETEASMQIDGLQEPTADSSSREIAQDREGRDALRDSLLEELQSQLQVGY